jgi:hypothetical protein
VTEASPAQLVAGLLPRLRSGRVTYFPIRHHSPACAAHLRRWIRAHRPASVLVEGPASFTSKIPLLIDERCVFPVALFTNFIDKRNRLGPATGSDSGQEKQNIFGPPRFAAYYPFCDYSPELVALRNGHAAGAQLRFIDLEYAEMILARQSAEPGAEPEGVRIDSLAADPHLRHSEYIAALTRRLGCRDFNELWDHLFESCSDGLDTDAFIDRVATYCAMARLDYTPEHLRRDGTTAREACMAAAIGEELARNQAEGRAGPILVVTGGFHTVALPDLVAARTQRPAPLALTEGEAGTWLMRYSFDQLDALAGYASGMPSPSYYDRLWKATAEEELPNTAPPEIHFSAVRTRVAAAIVVEVGRLTRERNLATAVSTPDAIAAVQVTRQLAAMRGHPWPLREDVLDGIRTCFVKGEMNGEGQVLLGLVHQVLAGDRVGKTPPGTNMPPIVDDFHATARRLRLPIDRIERRELTLDLYRNAGHRHISRLCHRLDLLEVPFALFQGGPDFVQGQALDLMQERWTVSWSPATDTALIEASVYGPTLEEAVAAKLRQQIAQLQDEGASRNTAAAVALLVRACCLGLHDQAASLVPLIEVHVAEDPALPSVVNGLSQLELLAHAREPLEAGHLTALPRLLVAAFQRACRLVNDIATCPDEAVAPIMAALRTLREVLAASRARDDAGPGLDPELFHQALHRVVSHPPAEAQAAVVGAVAGILYGEGKLSEEALVRVTCGFLGGTASEARKSCGVLRGLLATAREAAWQVKAVIEALDEQFQTWDEATFLNALPELRLAFADLTPREVSRVADRVAGFHDEADLGELIHVDLGEEEVQFGLELSRRVREALRSDSLLPGGNL